MEKTSSNTLSSSFSSLAGFIGVLFFDDTIRWVTGIQEFYSNFRCFFQSRFEFIYGKSKGRCERKVLNSVSVTNKGRVNEEDDDGKLSSEDVKMVMGQLRIVCNQDDDDTMIQDRMGLEEMTAVFEEKEPSLEEVKEAFDVFDENKDGFVDAMELQRVLSSLGFREGSMVEECEKMIRVFDDNKDGKIDFNEFFKLMESSFC